MDTHNSLFFEIIVGRHTVLGTIATADVENVTLLSDYEKKIWENDKRFRTHRLDWLAARTAAKRLLMTWRQKKEYHLIAPQEITVNSDSNGAPRVCWGTKENAIPEISLSHSFNRGLAFVGQHECILGCDIERVKKRGSDFWKYIVTSQELSGWSNLSRFDFEEGIIETHAWSAKESAIKCLSHCYGDISVFDIFVTPQLSRTKRLDGFSFLYKDLKGNGKWIVFSDFVICVAVIDNPNKSRR